MGKAETASRSSREPHSRIMLSANPGLRNQSMFAMPPLVEGALGGNLEDTSQHSDQDTETFGWRMDAWAKAPTLRSLELPIPKPRMPCLALRCDENGRGSARTFKGTELGADIAIKPGSHSFVRVPGEDFIRASRTRSLFGKASGHGILSDEKPVLFAGEIEINEDGHLIRWNNVSGTYRFHQQHAAQAELPLDRFWGLVEDLEVPMRAEDSADWVCLCNGLWLQRYEEAALSEQAWSCEEVYASMLDVGGPSAIGEIKDDNNRLRAHDPDRQICQMATLVTRVDASAAESSAEMTVHAAGHL